MSADFEGSGTDNNSWKRATSCLPPRHKCSWRFLAYRMVHMKVMGQSPKPYSTMKNSPNFAMAAADRRNHLVLVDKGRLVYQRNGLQRVDWQESHWRHMFIDGVTNTFRHGTRTIRGRKRRSYVDGSQSRNSVCTDAMKDELGGFVPFGRGMSLPSSKRRRWAVVQDEEAFKVQLAVHIETSSIGLLLRKNIGLASARSSNVPSDSSRRPNQSSGWGDATRRIGSRRGLFCIGLVEVRTNGDTTVGFLKGRKCIFFPCDHARIRRITSARSKLLDSAGKEDISVIVPLSNVQPLREDWFAFLPSTERNITKQIHNEWLEEMYTGKGYDNLPVMICGAHHMKGSFGTVVGYHRPWAAQEATTHIEFRTNERGKLTSFWKPDEDVVSLTVQFDGKHEKITVPLKHVVERYSRKPLWEYKLMRSFDTGVVSMRENAGLRSSKCAPIPSGPSDPLSAAVDVQLTRTSDLYGECWETTGDWLTMPKLAGKRIDVKLLGMNTTRFPKHAPPRSMAYENGTGYMVPFKTPLQSGMFTRQNFKVQLDGSRKSIGVPADAIRPCRQNPDGSSIDSTKCRVIIVGPDVDGNNSMSENMQKSYLETRLNRLWPSVSQFMFHPHMAHFLCHHYAVPVTPASGATMGSLQIPLCSEMVSHRRARAIDGLKGCTTRGGTALAPERPRDDVIPWSYEWLKDAGFSIAKGQTQNVRVRIVRESDRRRATRMVAALVMIRKIEVDGEPARLPFTGVLVPIEDGDPLDGEIQSRKPRTISRHASDDTSGMELHGGAVHIVVDTAHEVEGQWVMRMNSHPNYRRD
ncbi:hypothetical protein B0H12DRAFT_1078864 [Mycena haematopus]|nr:hypothetical protein B0H12DRAFT_1078864 [Mycena haematopus]